VGGAGNDQGEWRVSAIVSSHIFRGYKRKSLICSSNITVATFSEFGFYKKEAYDANLWAGKILAEHGVPVAYKSVSYRQRNYLNWVTDFR
jgi:hypothetical protein